MGNFIAGMLTGITLTIMTYHYLRLRVVVRYIRYYTYQNKQHQSSIGKL